MKERIQHTINQIKGIVRFATAATTVDNREAIARPKNSLSSSIRNEKEVAQFKAALNATATGKVK